MVMDENIKILKLMSEVTNRIDLNEFAKLVDSTPKQVLQGMDDLSKTEFVKKTGGGYGITEKGKTLLKAYNRVPENMDFVFYLGIGQPTNLNAKSLKEFQEQIKKADLASIEFHMHRNDFARWIKTAINDGILADEFFKISNTEIKGENLREEILKIVEMKYYLNP
jgi:predicted transcriptional regulator